MTQQLAAQKLADFDRDAYAQLAKTGAVPDAKVNKRSQAEQQAAVVAAAKRRVEARSRRAYHRSGESCESREFANRKFRSPKDKSRSRKRKFPRTRAETEQAQAQLAQAQADRSDLTVVAPFAGTVITRAAEPGEVVQAGTAIVTLLDLSKVYLRGFIPEGEIGKVKIGQPAHIYLDSDTNQAARRIRVAHRSAGDFHSRKYLFSRRSREASRRREAATHEGIGFAKPGMPADGEILTDGSTWPPHKRVQ